MEQHNIRLLERLNLHNLEYVVIGGISGVLQGVSLVTYDLDICCPFVPENLRKLDAALRDLQPCHRLTANRLPLELTDDLLARLRNLYLQTDWGKLDCLSEVLGLGNYADVLNYSVGVPMSIGLVRTLSLEALIQSKEAAGRDKDLAAVKQLRAILEARTTENKKTSPDRSGLA